MTVCLDALGADAARPYIERAEPRHPSLIDVAHLTDERFGVVNIPNSIWIDEAGTIVRPAEPAFPDAPDVPDSQQAAQPPPGRLGEMMALAGQIVTDRAAYLAALHDWVEHGAASAFALDPGEVIARSGRRGNEQATAAAEFELGQHLYRSGDLDGARAHFGESQRLHPNNWTYKRQAWSLEPGAIDGPLARFWQGPLPDHEADWPYEGDWVSDAKAIDPANYYPRFQR